MPQPFFDANEQTDRRGKGLAGAHRPALKRMIGRTIRRVDRVDAEIRRDSANNAANPCFQRIARVFELRRGRERRKHRPAPVADHDNRASRGTVRQQNRISWGWPETAENLQAKGFETPRKHIENLLRVNLWFHASTHLLACDRTSCVRNRRLRSSPIIVAGLLHYIIICLYTACTLNREFDALGDILRRRDHAGENGMYAMDQTASGGGKAPAELGENGIVDIPTARAEAQAGRLLLVDIRTPMEWSRTGVGDAAEPISMQDPNFLQTIVDKVGNDASKPIAVICATGNRSSWLASEMRRLGFHNIYDVNEGMMGSFSGPGWLNRGLPTKQPI